jgi:archaellum biogenesis protein FlaJ (TadC family)
MKILHCFVKGIFVGTYVSFWGALTFALIAMLLTFFSLGDMDLSGYGASFVVGAGMAMFTLGLIFPVIPLVLAGTIAVCIYDRNSKVKSWFLAIFAFSIAFLLSMLFSGFVILDIPKENFVEIGWYIAVPFLPYLILFIVKLEDVVYLNKDDEIGNL